ncbi:phosphatase PAP2 family protein [Dinghuibacter silviterrae]|uniref:Undecaprenyl-diphosphatase n=1 Tax=Dinghuibacter silviterrae TaxID=1539049 RepID=A0A4V3GKL6_9BACT|nr:phosphatase PAP2 family protein [Dinghuibacter silviterrae]TDW96102.1 undecaprenyl-diphosphatase [Dinghuibacter silviterrae]
MTFVKWLLHADKQCFSFIQTHLTAAWLDPVMMLIRNPLTWIPLYAFILYWILRNDPKASIRFILLTLIAVGITDYTAASLFKPLFGRVRPCYDPDVMGLLRGLINCGGLYSFPSNHATNHFCMAAFWFGSVRSLKGKRWYWLWAWAALVCFAQVYVGKHFPLDVTVGAIYGMAVGAGAAWVFRQWPQLWVRRAKEKKVCATSGETASAEYTPG